MRVEEIWVMRISGNTS